MYIEIVENDCVYMYVCRYSSMLYWYVCVCILYRMGSWLYKFCVLLCTSLCVWVTDSVMHSCCI